MQRSRRGRKPVQGSTEPPAVVLKVTGFVFPAAVGLIGGFGLDHGTTGPGAGDVRVDVLDIDNQATAREELRGG